MTEILKSDVVVIGGGAAGLRSALEAADRGHQVIVLCKGQVGKSGITPLASDGISASINTDDTIESHLEESLRVAQGICDPNLINLLVKEAPDRVNDLVRYGAKFKLENDNRFFHPTRSGKRDSYTCYINGGGVSLNNVLKKAVQTRPNIQIIEDVMALRFVKEEDQVAGVIALDIASGKIIAISAGVMILATGGYEELWHFTDTSTDSTGEGLVLAMESGADLVDLEMVLFHPFVVIHPPSANGCFVPYDIVNAIGARLLNGKMRDLCQEVLPPTAFLRTAYRAICEADATPNGGFYFKIESDKSKEEVIEYLRERLGIRYTHLKKLGISLHTDLVEMAPGAHYCLGGIRIDEDCRTNVKGLFAAGEVSGNIHGASRLFSNALTETQVFGYRAGRAATPKLHEVDFNNSIAQVEREIQNLSSGKESPAKMRSDLKMIMWNLAGLVRREDLLSNALEKITLLSNKSIRAERNTFCQQLVSALEVKAMLKLSEAVVKSCLARTESRGHHYREDYPRMSETWKAHTRVRMRDAEIVVDKISL